MKAKEMYEKLLKLYEYTIAKKNGRHPEYREEKFRGMYIETKPKEDYQLTIRITNGDPGKTWCMSYVCIHNLKTDIKEFFYVMRDFDHYNHRHIKHDDRLNKDYSHINLVNNAYKIFIGERDENN